MISHATERELNIVGEALAQASELDRSISKIKHAKKFINLHNFLLEKYDKVKNDKIWKIVNKDLLELEFEIK
jgi:uncharacterized protein with HEPN domain